MREDIDPRIDKMIAFLYGELPPAEEAAFRRLLEADEALRLEFAELSSARGALAEWKLEEAVPSFVLMESAEPKPAPRAAGDSPLRRFFASLRGLGASPAWGLATAAVALAVLAVAGFRIDRVPGGIAFRFGERPAATTPQDYPGVGESRPLELAKRPDPSSGSGVVPVSGTYLTQEEFNAYNSQLMSTLATLLNQYDQRRDREMTDLVQSLYRRVNDQQVFDYERTNRRIDALGEQFLGGAERGTPVEDLLKNEREQKPTNPAPGAGKE